MNIIGLQKVGSLNYATGLFYSNIMLMRYKF